MTGLAASTSYTFTVSAYNSGGPVAASASVSATTSASSGGGGGGGGGSSGLPAHVLMGYWQDFTNGATPLTLAAVPTSYNLVAVAFGDRDRHARPGHVQPRPDAGVGPRRVHPAAVHRRHRDPAGPRPEGHPVGRRPERHDLRRRRGERERRSPAACTRSSSSTGSTASTSTWRTASTRRTWPRRSSSWRATSARA